MVKAPDTFGSRAVVFDVATLNLLALYSHRQGEKASPKDTKNRLAPFSDGGGRFFGYLKKLTFKSAFDKLANDRGQHPYINIVFGV